MDIADIFIGLIRVCMDFCNKYITFFIYLMIMLSFIYFRFVCYVFCIPYINSFKGRLTIDGFNNTVTIINILLISLLILNSYWLFLLTRMGYRFLTKSKTHDLQMVVAKKDIKLD